jgi:hypothetical protein
LLLCRLGAGDQRLRGFPRLGTGHLGKDDRDDKESDQSKPCDD